MTVTALPGYLGYPETRTVPRSLHVPSLLSLEMRQPVRPVRIPRFRYRSFMKDLIKAHPEIPSLTPHELRHTRATLWSAQGVPQHLIADLLGHCDTRMLERVYNHTTTDTLRQALEAVQTKEGERA